MGVKRAVLQLYSWPQNSQASHTKHYITDAVLKGTYLITVDNVLHIDFTRFMPPVLPTIFNGCNCFVAMNIAAILVA
jgi:hypothetical protein